MVLLEEELDKLEERCKVATEKMEEATVNCDESERYYRGNVFYWVIGNIRIRNFFLLNLF